MIKNYLGNKGISPVIRVILMVFITIVIATVVFSFLPFAETSVSSSVSAGVSVENGQVIVNTMGSAKKSLVKRNGTTFELNSTGASKILLVVRKL